MRFRASATVSCRGIVAIEFAICLSGRIGGASGPPNGPWHEIDRTLRACEGDAIVTARTSP